MLRTALVSTLVSAGLAAVWLAFSLVERRRARNARDADGPLFEALLQ